jgi:hypothetical protein
MNPSFGVPWPRLQRAAARLTELHPARAERGAVPSLLFLGGLTYLLSYREATGRRLSHYLDDGLREAVDHTLPALMKQCAEFPARPLARLGRYVRARDNTELQQLRFGFARLQQRWPTSTAKWMGTHEGNLVRLAFGFGVVARFAPESHQFVRRMLEHPLDFPTPVLDVLESFRWDPEWSVTLAT